MAAVLGIYAGAVTNTPALGAPWQTLSTLVLDCAHTEAQSVRGGIGAVKLMGPPRWFHQGRRRSREPGRQFRARPRIASALNAFLAALKQRMLMKSHVVIAVAGGAGQDLLAADASEREASGNVKLKDIGAFLLAKIECISMPRATR